MPVGLIPKEFLVTSVGCDMVNHYCLGQSTFDFTLNTEWMNF
ncbi:hypothetical protein Javan618_0027 [Streptococcus phage Javan618]|nr:hypothetical protein Javan369_0030 [Streptococcus phage Javan369]QBX21473.1 hypothetical protein Javan575_0030 [Streptococcus phage Javan575]QBX31177.1 hypothetical protein Javan618_0027 [Streptococcus phage Javan618]